LSRQDLSPSSTLLTSRFEMLSTVVVHGRGASACIDPGYFPDELEIIRAVLLEGRRPLQLFICTHSDFDHVLLPPAMDGCEALLQEESRRVDPAAVEEECSRWDASLQVRRDPPMRFPPRIRMFSTRLDLSGEGLELLAVHAPGHTADSAVVIHLEERWAHAGDMLSDREFPFAQHSPSVYLDTLRRLPALFEDHGVERVVPGHGRVAAGRPEIDRRLHRDIEYLQGLYDGVSRLVKSGAPADEILARMGDLPYDGSPVPPRLRLHHDDNVRLSIEEQTKGRRSVPD
jgi:hydroxyacylglutathione hydrolase